ncbi:unnamed protein product [Withania somnifera]
MPKKSNYKNPKPVELAAAVAPPVVEKSKPISSSKPQKDNEIDEIFAGKKRKKPENQEKTSGAAVADPKKVKKSKGKSSRITKDNKDFSEPARKSRKKTADGFSLYTEEELGIGRANAGGTPLCPFDCDCCF